MCLNLVNLHTQKNKGILVYNEVWSIKTSENSMLGMHTQDIII